MKTTYRKSKSITWHDDLLDVVYIDGSAKRFIGIKEHQYRMITSAKNPDAELHRIIARVPYRIYNPTE